MLQQKKIENRVARFLTFLLFSNFHAYPIYMTNMSLERQYFLKCYEESIIIIYDYLCFE